MKRYKPWNRKVSKFIKDSDDNHISILICIDYGFKRRNVHKKGYNDILFISIYYQPNKDNNAEAQLYGRYRLKVYNADGYRTLLDTYSSIDTVHVIFRGMSPIYVTKKDRKLRNRLVHVAMTEHLNRHYKDLIHNTRNYRKAYFYTYCEYFDYIPTMDYKVLKRLFKEFNFVKALDILNRELG